MGTQAQASFSIKNWDENTWDGKNFREVTGKKLTRAEVTYTYTGDIEGESLNQMLMSYCGDGTYGSFVALEQVTGSLGGKKGSFVLQHAGTFNQEGVHATITVVPDSGTGELAGLRGKGSYDLAGHQESYPLSFEYEFESTPVEE